MSQDCKVFEMKMNIQNQLLFVSNTTTYKEMLDFIHEEKVNLNTKAASAVN